MTISETDRLHSQLSRFEDMFPGYRTEIVEGNIVMSPLGPFHNQTIMALWMQLEGQLTDERDTFPYGGTVTVETSVGKLDVDTAKLPIYPSGT